MEKSILIVGAGTAGIMIANKLAARHHTVTIIDPAEDHYYQPGFLFVPFGKAAVEKLHRPVTSLLKPSINRVVDRVAAIDPSANQVRLESGGHLAYDVIIIATGTRIDPSRTEGLIGPAWHKTIFDYYTPQGATALQAALAEFSGGRLVVQIMDMPIKCPVAPLEFTFLADDFFRRRGLRDKVDITFVTSLSGAFTKPVASKKLSHLMSDKHINVVTDFYVEKVVPETNTIRCYDERELQYDLLVTIPVNVGASFLQEAEFANDLGFVEVNHHSLQSTKYPNMFAVGDAADVPTSKAGSVAHFEVETVVGNVERLLAGQPLEESFDGHSNCFVEFGDGKALLLDFNYDVEPLEGLFPFPVVGPLRLLHPSRINHLGKLAFQFIYWNMLLPGRTIPFIPAHMSMRGKKRPPQEPEQPLPPPGTPAGPPEQPSDPPAVDQTADQSTEHKHTEEQ